jgi:flavorubredoxin
VQVRTDEIAEGVYRISAFVADVPPRGFTFNQFLVDADEPLLYHTGMRALFPLVSEAVAAVVPLERLRWIAFSHVEADECGAVEQFLAAAPRAQVAHGALGCQVSLDDMLSRPPVPLADGQVLDLGGKQLRARRVRHVDTPHVPHNWEARVLYEEHTGTLLCGDLGSQLGHHEPLVEDLVDEAIEAERVFRASSLSPAVPATLRRLAETSPSTLAVMHGSSFSGDGARVLRELATAYESAFPELCLAGTAPAVPEQSGPAAGAAHRTGPT